MKLFDQFEKYTVNFSVHYPLDDGEHMNINGETDQLGDWHNGKGPLEMQISKEEVVWLTGEKVHPW